MFTVKPLHWTIALVLSIPSAVVLVSAVGLISGAAFPTPVTVENLIAAVNPIAFFSFWAVFTAYALTGKSPKAVFKRTCASYATAVFLFLLSAIYWLTKPSPIGCGPDMFRCDFMVVFVAFLLGPMTGLLALLLGFWNFKGPIPGIDGPPSSRIPPV